MQFKRYGKAYQLRIETPDDLDEILNLDEALWAATSAPLSAFRCDRTFLKMMDRDGNGRITSEEMRAALRWVRVRLAERQWLTAPFEALPLSALNTATQQGRALKSSAEDVLRTLGQTDATALSLEQIRNCLANLDKQPFNGDGVITAKSASDPNVAVLIADAVAVTGGTTDAGGEPGITLAQLDAFGAASNAWLDWNERGAGALAAGRESAVMPFGAETPAIYDSFQALCANVDDYFELCRMRRYDPHLTPSDRGGPTAVEGGRVGVAELRDWLATEPLARLSPDGMLSLCGPETNPFHAEGLAALRRIVLSKCLDKTDDTLSEDDWRHVKRLMKPYADYMATRPTDGAERVPQERLLRYRQEGALVETVRALIAQDAAVAGLRKGMDDLERLWLYAAHLMRLANNFTSFSELYDPKKRALFERGSAVIDGRWFNLALKADDANAHQAVAKSANIFTVYLEVERLTGDGKFTVALPATYGTKGNLREGKRGVFFDVDGIEYDARIVKIIENPISLREALVSPLFRLRDFVVGKIESISGANEKEMEKSADALFKPAAAPPPAAAAQGSPMGSAGVLVGLGVATAALGSAFAYISNTVIGMSAAQRLLSLLGAVAVVFVPVSLVAVMKLRSQDLSSLLEACGWAVNARLRLSRAQRRQFTRKAPFPAHAQGTPGRRWWPVPLAVALSLALLVGLRMANRRRAAPSASVPVETVVESAENAARQDAGQE